jgi:hypothetical protein
MLVLDFLRWMFFSWSGAVYRGKESLGIQAHTIYMAAKRPLIKERCKYCGTVYWSYTKGNKYCGTFRCFRKVIRALPT